MHAFRKVNDVVSKKQRVIISDLVRVTRRTLILLVISIGLLMRVTITMKHIAMICMHI